MAKATRQTPPAAFVPVVLTLESQDEVDAVYGSLVESYQYVSHKHESFKLNCANEEVRKNLRAFCE